MPYMGACIVQFTVHGHVFCHKKAKQAHDQPITSSNMNGGEKVVGYARLSLTGVMEAIGVHKWCLLMSCSNMLRQALQTLAEVL